MKPTTGSKKNTKTIIRNVRHANRLLAVSRRGIPRALRCTAGLVLALPFAVILASDPPDSETRPGSTAIETVDSTVVGSSYDVRHTIDDAPNPTITAYLSNGGSDDLGPRIEIASDGATWVAWWRDGASPQVLGRYLPDTNSSWDPEVTLSDSGESASAPELLADGTDFWLVYEVDASGDTSIVVAIVVDEPDPIGNRTTLRTTAFGGDVDPLVHAADGHVWVTWVDSSTDVGWSEWDDTTQTWSVPDYEDYSADSIADARDRVETEVTG